MPNTSFSQNIAYGIRHRLGRIFHNPFHAVNINPVKEIYYKHLLPGPVRIHKLFGKDLFFVSATELLHGLEEIFVQEIYKQPLPASPYIIDCGANIGLSVIFMKRQYPDAEILAFEPDTVNFTLLQKNITSFGFDRIHLRQEAVWKENTTLQFASAGSMASRITLGSTANDHDSNNPPASLNFSDSNSSQTLFPVQAIRLQDYLTRKVDFLKIDIEGAEFEVMMDIAPQLHHVDHLFLEYHGSFAQNGELNQLFRLLESTGFSYYIKEAASVYEHPFARGKNPGALYDIQLNIFCFRNK